jgi:hypothetical protein
MVKLSLEMKKRDVVWASLVVILLGAGLVFAFTYDGSGEPSVMGHSLDELNLTGFGGGSGFSCDSGFTKIGNLGCMQNDLESSSRNWKEGMGDCNVMGGGKGRLPTFLEWYTAMDDYPAVTVSGVDEWVFDPSYYTSSVHADDSGYHLVAKSTLGDVTWNKDTSTNNAVRCFIPA